MYVLLSSFALQFTHLIEEVLPALLGDRWLAAIEQCFSCTHILVYRIVQVLLGIRMCFALYRHWRVLSRWWSKNGELKEPCRLHMGEVSHHWLVTWCRMCGSDFWLYTCKVIMLPITGDCQAVFFVSVQQERKCLTIPCYSYAPAPTNRSGMLWFSKICCPKPKHHFYVMGFSWSLVSVVSTYSLVWATANHHGIHVESFCLQKVGLPYALLPV
jgi:hypothetical protein